MLRSRHPLLFDLLGQLVELLAELQLTNHEIGIFLNFGIIQYSLQYLQDLDLSFFDDVRLMVGQPFLLESREVQMFVIALQLAQNLQKFLKAQE